MDESKQFTPCASLAAAGLQFQRLGIWPLIVQQVQIKQKVRTHSPHDKLLDCWINMLAGGRGVVEVNTRVRADPVLQRAFGRSGCAEQSTISDTLDACAPENVQQLRQALACVVRQHAQAFLHDYHTRWQLLDVDMTGLCAGRQGEGVSKGYFAQGKNARGRQLGRVIATAYDEIIAEQLFAGKRQLETSLLDLVDASAQTLQLAENQRKHTLVRIDGGGGSDANINALLKRRYQLLVKVHNWQRARKLAASVPRWFRDPKVSERELGWIGQPHAYARATDQIAIRKRDARGRWTYAVIVSTVPDAQLCQLNRVRRCRRLSARRRALLIVYGYDRRGGGAETQNRSDKQGLGLARRNKRRFVAQEMLVLLAQWAHNVVIWTRNALARPAPRLARYGIQRMVRDVFRIPGVIRFDAVGKVHVTLSAQHPLAAAVVAGFRDWCLGDELSVNLGKI